MPQIDEMCWPEIRLLCEGVTAVRWAGIGLITAGVFLVSGT